MGGMKTFYLALGVLTLAGGGALWWASARGTAAVPIGEIPQADIDAARGFYGYAEGSADAPVEIIEYADFQCPACRQLWVLTIQDVKERLVKTGKVRLVFRDFPLDVHTNSRPAHHAAACAAEQNLFAAMHDQLFLHQPTWAASDRPERLLREYAESIGVDVDQYDECMASGRYRGRIQASFQGGVDLGINATPSFIIGNNRYPGMVYDQVKAIVDSLILASP